MSDKDRVQAENEKVVEDNNQDASPVDEPTTSESNESDETDSQPSSAEETGDDTKSEEDDSERKPSRAEKRIRELSSKVKELESSNQSSQQFEQPPQIQPNEDGEITPDQLRQYVAQEAEAISNRTAQQIEAKANLNNDMNTISSQFKEFDENSDDYIPELEQAVSEEFSEKAFKVVGIDPVTGNAKYALDPNVRLAEIAKRHVNVARAAAKKSTASLKNSVAKAADESAIRPSSERKSEKPFEELSEREMEERLGFAE